MTAYDPRAELASRDIVVRGMVAEMRREGTEHVYLDATHLDAAWLQRALPQRHGGPARARSRPRHAAHPGRAGVPLLRRRRRHRRVGPHHGAGPVRERGGGEHRRPRRQPAREQLAARGPRVLRPRGARPRPLHRPAGRGRAPPELRHPGGDGGRRRQRRGRRPPPAHRRHAAQGRRAAPRPASCRRRWTSSTASPRELRFGRMGEAEYEVLNMLTLGTQIAKCALLREESRGVHLRDDFPELDDEHWRKHITLRLPAHERTEGVGKVGPRVSERSYRQAARAAARARPARGPRRLRRPHRVGVRRRRRRARGRARGRRALRRGGARGDGAAGRPGARRGRPRTRRRALRRRRRHRRAARPAGGDPRRRAHGAQLPLPAERRGDADGRVRRRDQPAPRRASPRRARPRPACAPSRSRPWCTAAARRTASASSTAR